MSDDPARTVTLAMAEDICPSCTCCNRHGAEGVYFRDNKDPCPFFHPDNFYYDSKMKRFWCHNWVDKEENETPAPKTSPEDKA
jgi:hypothetical protein